MVNVITSYYDNSSSILTGAPRLSLTKYFRDRFWQVSLTKIRKTCMQSCRFATSTWHGFTKGVCLAPLLLLVSETGREIVTFLQPYIFAKQTTSDGRQSILSV